MLATDYAKYYQLPAQADGESDYDFKYRVAGELRKQGKLIEAHEASNDALYDQNENVMTGVFGAVAFSLEGRSFNGDPIHPSNGQRQIDDDFAAGVIVKNPKKEMTPDMALMMVAMFGKNK